MDNPPKSFDFWRIPILALWTAFFAVGLYPEWVYDQMRDLGQVASQRALTNSAWLITISWAGYLGWFTRARCREAEDTHASAAAKGVQVLLLGLTAFMPLRLENIAEYQYIPVPEYRWILYGMITAKCISWLYLVLAIVRYCLFSGYRVFINMPAFFPSAHEPGPGDRQTRHNAGDFRQPQAGLHIADPAKSDAKPGANNADEAH